MVIVKAVQHRPRTTGSDKRDSATTINSSLWYFIK